MKKLRNAIEFCTEKELEMANDEFPMFRSDHEGVAIIEEEIYEAECEIQNVINAFNALKIEMVFGDREESEKAEVAKAMKKAAQNLSCEAVQVAAMAQKFLDSTDYRKEKEKFVVQQPTFLGVKDKLSEIMKAFEEVK